MGNIETYKSYIHAWNRNKYRRPRFVVVVVAIVVAVVVDVAVDVAAVGDWILLGYQSTDPHSLPAVSHADLNNKDIMMLLEAVLWIQIH
jgi:hypothetical protein